METIGYIAVGFAALVVLAMLAEWLLGVALQVYRIIRALRDL